MANDTNAIFKFIKDMISDDDDEVKKRGVIPGLGNALNYGQPEEVKYNRTSVVPAVASQAQTTLKPVASTVPPINIVPPVSGDLIGEGNSSGVPTEFPNVPVPKSENFVPELYQPLRDSSVSEGASGLVPQFIKDIPDIPFIRDNIIDPVSNVYEGLVADESKIPVA